MVHAANEHDGKAGFKVIETLNYRFDRMKKNYADAGYRGELVNKKKLVGIWKNQLILNCYLNIGLLKELFRGWKIPNDWQKIMNTR
jgi:hypothetical protein